MEESATSLGPPVLFSTDLERSLGFYRDLLGMKVAGQDEHSVVLLLDSDMIILLDLVSARELLGDVDPTTPGDRSPSSLLNFFVDDVDAWCTTLADAGVEIFVAPVDRPWGRRTAHLKDPDGYVWEISQEIG